MKNTTDGYRAFASAASTTTELYLDHCLAAEKFPGVRVGGGAGNTVTTVSNSTVVRNSGDGIIALSNGTVRVFGNTVTNKLIVPFTTGRG